MKIKCCTLFFLCQFLLEGFLYKVFNKTTCAIQLTNAMYFSKNRFSIGFSDGVFNEACAYRGNRPMESVVKYTDLIPRRNGEGRILILVRLYVGS